MALTQENRIALSKKIIDIPKQDASSVKIQATLESSKIKAQKEDDANKALMDDVTPIINEYQNELALLDGNVRNELTEQNMIDSADHILQNFFFPNDLNTPLPSISDGVWKKFPPFAGNVGIGKTYTEGYGSTDTEISKITPISPIITTLEGANTETQLTTGQECIEGDPLAGFCTGDTPPGATDETTCTTNGGVWTSVPTDDVIQPKADTQADIVLLKNAIIEWETHLGLEKTAIEAANAIETDATRLAQNAIALADINNTLAIIDAWQALPDFYTAHGAIDCDDFNALNPSLFPATKLASAELTIIKDEITDRTSFQSSRSAELITATYLGSVTQDLNSGGITAADGLYGRRFRIIDMRLNLMAGSLNKVRGLERSQSAQEESKASNANATTALSTVMAASAFRAPSSGTSTIHVLDGSLFSPSDSAYVTANTQEEISVTIVSISGNTIFLDTKIPKKYRQNDGARLYKVL